MTEREPDATGAIVERIPPTPFQELQLLDREQLRICLQPKMTLATFSNWVQRAQRERGFPEPIRTGNRACAWSLLEVKAWIQSRPRKGVFAGKRRQRQAGAAA